MEKKLITFLLIAGAALFLSACDGNKNAEEEMISVEMNNGSAQVGMSKEQGELARLMAKGAKVRCEYALREGDDEMKTTLYLEGEKFRTEVNSKDIEAVGIFDGEYYYNWTKGNGMKQGSKMSRECSEEMGGEVEGNEEMGGGMQFRSAQEIEDQEVELKMNCMEVDEIDFSVPSEVDFVDTCEMMNRVRNQNQIESMDMEEIQKQMEQMQGNM